MVSQIAAQIAKTLVIPSNSFFPGGILGESSPSPKQLPAYIPQKLSWWKKRSWFMWKEKVLSSVREGRKVKVEDIPKGGRLKIFSHSRSKLFGKKKSNANLHE
jgi:hypothetical protein